MKTYRMSRINGEAIAHVEENGIWEPLPFRLDLANHSPDGFEWGYQGSGPAQLALAILADLYQVPVRERRRTWLDETSIAEKFYQEFKTHFIAPAVDEDGWFIQEQEIREWITAKLAEHITHA